MIETAAVADYISRVVQRRCVNDVHLHVCAQGPSPPSHETSHNLREKDFRDYRQDRRHPRDRDADRSHVCLPHVALYDINQLFAIYTTTEGRLSELFCSVLCTTVALIPIFQLYALIYEYMSELFLWMSLNLLVSRFLTKNKSYDKQSELVKRNTKTA